MNESQISQQVSWIIVGSIAVITVLSFLTFGLLIARTPSKELRSIKHGLTHQPANSEARHKVLNVTKVPRSLKSPQRDLKDLIYGHYINLPQATERRRHMETLLRDLKLPFPITRLEASSPSTIQDPFLQVYKQHAPHRGPQAACVDSHLRAMRNFLASGKPFYMNLEDDIELHPEYTRQDFQRVLTLITNSCNAAYTWLGSYADQPQRITPKGPPAVPPDIVPELEAYQWREKVFCYTMHCLLLRRDFVEAFVKLWDEEYCVDPTRICRPVDHLVLFALKRHPEMRTLAFNKPITGIHTFTGFMYQSRKVFGSSIPTSDK